MRLRNKSSFQNRTKTLRFLIFELLRFSHILLHLRPGHPAAGTSSKATITTIILPRCWQQNRPNRSSIAKSENSSRFFLPFSLSLSHFLTLFERRSRNVNKTGPLVLINGYDLSERRAQLSEVVLLLVGW